MAELTETELITKINDIDTAIATATAALASTDADSVQFLDYTMGNKSVSGSARLKQLLEARKVYQEMLNGIPSSITRDHGYQIKPGTGSDETEYVGDE